MADAELSVVIQLRDLLTKELERLNGVLAQFETKAAGGFTSAAQAAQTAQASVSIVGAEAGRVAAALAQTGAAGTRAFAEVAKAGGSIASSFDVGRAAESLTSLGVKGTIAAAQLTEAFRAQALAADSAVQAAAGIGPAATVAAAQAQTANQAAIASATQLGGAISVADSNAKGLGATLLQIGAAASTAFVAIPADVGRAAESLVALGPKGTIAAAQMTEAFRAAAVTADRLNQAAAGVGPAATLAAAQVQTANDAAIASATQMASAIGLAENKARGLAATLLQAGAAASSAFVEIPADVNRAAESLVALGPKGTIAAAQMTEAFRVSAAAADRSGQAASGIGIATTIAAAQAQTANQAAIASATQLGGALTTAAAGAGAAGQAAGAAATQTAQLGGQAKATGAALQSVGTSARSAGVSVTALGNTIRSALLPVLPFITAAGAGFAALQSVRAASDFSREIASIATIARDGETSIASLRREVLELAKAYGQSPVDQARGLYLAISSGAETAAEGVEILRASTRLAIAGLASTESTVDLITAALNSYANQNLQAADAADILFKTVELGKGRVEDLALNYGRALPLGAALNISFKELSATMASLTLTQGSVEQASTSLRSVLSGLLQISDEQRESLKRLGADVTPAAIGVNGLTKTLVDLAGALKKDTDATREIFPDIRALSGVLALVNDGGEDLLRVLGRFGAATGSVGRAVETQLADPANQLIRILNAAKISFSQAFGQAVLTQVSATAREMGGVKNAVDLVSSAADRVGKALFTVIPAAVKFVEGLARQISSLEGGFDGTVGSLLEIAQALAVVAEASTLTFGNTLQFLDLLKDSVDETLTSIKNVGIDGDDLAAAGSALVTVASSIDELRSSSGLSTVSVEALSAAMADLEGRFTGDKSKKLRDAIEAVRVDGATIGSLRTLRVELARVEAGVEDIVRNGSVADGLRRALTEFDVDTTPIRERFAAILRKSFGDGAGIKVPIDLQVEEKSAEIKGLLLEIEKAKQEAARVSVRGRSDTISLDFADRGSGKASALLDGMVLRVSELQEKLRAAQGDLVGLRSAARESLELELEVKTDQLEKMRAGLIDARTAVEALGLTAEQTELLSGKINTGGIEALERDVESLKARLSDAPVQLRLSAETQTLGDIERAIAGLRERAQTAIKLGTDDKAVAKSIQSIATAVDSLHGKANESRQKISDLKAEARAEIEVKISAKLEEIEALKKSMQDTRSTAKVLGLTAEQAGKLLGVAFQSGKAEELDAELVGLRAELLAFSETTVVVKKRLDFSSVADESFAAIKKLVGALRSFDTLRDGLARAQAPAFIDQAVEAFRGGVEPSLERQLELIDKQVAKQRVAVAWMIRMKLVSAEVAAQFAAATDALAASAAEIAGAAEEAEKLTKIRAAELGIDVRFHPDKAGLERLLDATQRRLDLASRAGRVGLEIAPNFDEADVSAQLAGLEAIIQAKIEEMDFSDKKKSAFRLGVTVDDKSPAALDLAIRAAEAKLEDFYARAQELSTKRQALRFGIEIDGKSLAGLEAEISSAQTSAQEFIDSLSDRSDQREALRLGIEVEGVPPDVLRLNIEAAQASAAEFAEKNPLKADLLVTGVDAGARAFADIISGAKRGKEAVGEFFRVMAQQAAFAAAKLLIVKTLISAFGGSGTAIGGFLSATFGAAKGAVFPAQGVVAYARGGVPGRAAAEVARFGTVVNEGLPERAAALRAFASGGVPRNQVVRSPQVAPLALFGEAGPEAIMPLDAREGVRGLTSSGTVSLPLSRDSGGRLSVDLNAVLARAVTAATKLADGAAPPDLERLVSTRMATFALGGVPGLARSLRTEVKPFALGGVPGLARSLRTEVEPFALGGVPGLARSLRTEVEPFALGGVPGLARSLRTEVEPFAMGGVPSLTRTIRTEIQPFALGDGFSRRPPSVSPRDVAARQASQRTTTVEVRPNITINVSSLEGQTAAAVIMREKETIAAAVAQELSRSPLFRAHMRGDSA